MELANASTAFIWNEPLDINGVPMMGVPEKQGVSFGRAGYLQAVENKVDADAFNVTSRRAIRSLSGITLNKARKHYAFRQVVDFPSYFIVEPTTACNRACSFCSISSTNRHGMLSRYMFDDLMAECSWYPVYGISLYQLGEPFMWHDDVYRINALVDDAELAGFKAINLSTNGDVDNLELALKCNVSDLIISIDGITPKTYLKNRPMRGKSSEKDFYRTCNRTLDFLTKKYRVGGPYTRLQIINNESTRDEIVDFIRFWIGIPGVDDVYIKNLDSMRPWLKTQVVSDKDDAIKATRVANMPCQHLWAIGSVTSTGVYNACCHDARTELTDGSMIGKTSFYDWWHGDYMNKLRQDHIDGRFPYPCSECRERDCWLG